MGEGKRLGREARHREGRRDCLIPGPSAKLIDVDKVDGS